MALLSQADIADLSEVVSELAFHDYYQLLRKRTVGRDTAGNPLRDFREVESGWGSLQARDLIASEDQVGGRVTSQTTYQALLPLGTLCTSKDRIRIQGAIYDVVGVTGPGFLSLMVTAQLSLALLK